MRREALLGTLLFLAGTALSAPAVRAQVGSPTDFGNNPHPSMPWSGTQSGAYGTVLRYVPVAPQRLTLDVAVSTPPGVPAETRRQVVEVPGYYVVETTTGFYYPERWTIERLNAGVYQWRKLPPEFRRK